MQARKRGAIRHLSFLVVGMTICLVYLLAMLG